VKSELRGFTFYIKYAHLCTRIYVFIYKEGPTNSIWPKQYWITNNP